jgi:hypothetical protein
MSELAQIEDGALVIRIRKDALVQGTEYVLRGPEDILGEYRRVKVVDPDAWMREVVRVLNSEGDNGDTPVNILMDNAVNRAFDQGGAGILVKGIHFKKRKQDHE